MSRKRGSTHVVFPSEAPAVRYTNTAIARVKSHFAAVTPYLIVRNGWERYGYQFLWYKFHIHDRRVTDTTHKNSIRRLSCVTDTGFERCKTMYGIPSTPLHAFIGRCFPRFLFERNTIDDGPCASALLGREDRQVTLQDLTGVCPQEVLLTR